MVIGEILRRSAARFPDKPALIDGSRQVTYRELDQLADRCAAGLAALGFKTGDRLANIAPNVVEQMVLVFGAARAGVILGQVSVRASVNDLAYILDKIEASGLSFWGEFAANIKAACAKARPLRQIVSIGTGGARAGADIVSFDVLLERGGASAPNVLIADDDPFAMTFTGGTTGFPKAVLATHRARYANAVTCGVEFGLDERDICVLAAPLFHAAGLFVWAIPAIMLGCTCVLLRSWDAARFIATVERHRATATLLVPTQLADLVSHPAFSADRLASLRNINYAGSPMALALYDRLTAALPHVGFTENYGQSETGPMTVRRPFHPHDKRGTVGRPAHNVETKVVDSDGRECPPGVAGEIVSRGEHLLKEYWGEPEQTRALFRTGDGWLWTGDIGVRDEDGFISLVDRSKDMIVSGAENIYPTEIENALLQHPAVQECAVFGVPDDRWGEVPAAHVVLRHGHDPAPEQLVEFVAARIARYKRPRLVKFVDALPRTAVGKIQKNLIRDAYWKGRPRKI
jgi:acyl-CoA synthetase (AMP-forming)/AMP-acid ligase II